MKLHEDAVIMTEELNPKPEEGYVTVSVSLLIRLLEYAREDSPSDIDLHYILERIMSFGDEDDYRLSMSDYEKLVPAHRLVTVEVLENNPHP